MNLRGWVTSKEKHVRCIERRAREREKLEGEKREGRREEGERSHNTLDPGPLSAGGGLLQDLFRT